MDESRLEQLEIKAAFLEEAVGQLNEAVIRQQREIGRLTAGHEALLARVRELAEAAAPGGPEDDVPPHY